MTIKLYPHRYYPWTDVCANETFLETLECPPHNLITFLSQLFIMLDIKVNVELMKEPRK